MPEPEEPTTTPLPAGDPTGQVFVPADDAEPETIETDDAPRTSALRTATVISGRIVLGFVTLAAVGAVVAAATLIPLPTFGAKPTSRVVVPTPTAQQLVCPGGLLRLGSATGADATSVSALGGARITSAALGGAVRSSEFATTDAGTGHTSAAPRLLSGPPVVAGGAPTRMSGAQSQDVATTEFTGLAAAACGAASASTWLSGGSTAVGRTTLLLLANPSAVPATVSLRIYGEVGQVTAPGMDGIVVAPGSQHVLSIAGFAPNVTSPVVHVTSTGGQVAATLEQSTVRGLVPGGIDFVSGLSAPQSTTVIPGVVIGASAAVQSEIGQSGYDDLQTTVRLFVPGSKGTTAKVTVIPENAAVPGQPTIAAGPNGGAAHAQSTTTRVDAGRVTDLPLDSLSDGNYTVVVTSKLPIVASIRVSTASSAAATPATDFAWLTAAPLLTTTALLSVPHGMTPLLHLENPTTAAENVVVAGLDGTSQTVTVAAGSATSVTVTEGTSYELSGFTKLYASVSGTTDGGITGYVVSPPARADSALRVFG